MTDYSLSKQQRLLKPDLFKRVYSNRQFGNSEFFTFNVLGAQPELKLGVTVSKKVSKRAVDRNHIKRLVKEFFRLRKSDLNPAYLVITAKPAAANVSNKELQISLEELWQKLLKWQRWHKHQQTQSTTKND